MSPDGLYFVSIKNTEKASFINLYDQTIEDKTQDTMEPIQTVS